jgi:pimeloyl-ACP methyl ester carboxylesterase
LRCAPSIPGFGFSYNPERPGFEYPQIAESFNSLMSELGYSNYVAQGGDIGSFISCQIGQMYPESCRAVLVNMLVAAPPTFAKSPVAWLKWKTAPHLFYTKAEMDHLARTHWFFEGETGYQVGQLPFLYFSRHTHMVIIRQYSARSHSLCLMGFGIRP